MSHPRFTRTIITAPAVALVLACAGDAAKTALAPTLSAPDAPSRSITYACDTAYKVRLLRASFGSPSVAFTGVTLTYTAEVIHKASNTTASIGAIAEWTEVGQIFPKMNIGAPTVDLSARTITNTMQGVQTGMDSIRIKVGVPGGYTDRSACTTLPIDVQSGAPYFMSLSPGSGSTTPMDRAVNVLVSVRNNAGTRLPQAGTTFTWISGAAATVTPQNDSVFRVQPNAQGAASLQAAFNGLTQNYTLNACAPSTQATSLTLDRSTFPVLVSGGMAYISATALNCVGQSVQVTWQSSDPSVATVASYSATYGVVHAINPGTTYITASNGALSDVELLRVKLTPPTVQGSVYYDPSYPTGTASLSWGAVNGASSYQIYRTCRMANGYTPGWEQWSSTSDTSWTSYDYVMSYAGTAPPSGSYMAYYVIASGDAGDSNQSQILYFNWDEVAEPGC